MTANDRDCPPDGISPRQSLAIAALVAGESHERAAEAAHVTPRTLRRWLSSEDFKAALRTALGAALDDALVRLKASTSPAIDVLLDVARNAESEHARMQAAGKLLEANMRLLQDASRGFENGPIPTFIYSRNERAPTFYLGVEPKRRGMPAPISAETRAEVERLLLGNDNDERTDDEQEES